MIGERPDIRNIYRYGLLKTELMTIKKKEISIEKLAKDIVKFIK